MRRRSTSLSILSVSRLIPFSSWITPLESLTATTFPPSWCVRVLPDDPPQLDHEALAEAHHLAVGLPLRVEVGSSLRPADRKPREGILEDLLESEELDDSQVHGGVEPQSPLVRPQRAVELDAEAAVDLDLSPVVLPGDPEDQLPLRLADPLDDLRFGELRVLDEDRPQRLGDVLHRLVELGLPRVPLDHILVDRLQPLRQCHPLPPRDECGVAACPAVRFSRMYLP